MLRLKKREKTFLENFLISRKELKDLRREKVNTVLAMSVYSNGYR
jgi:hypothetical protein